MNVSDLRRKMHANRAALDRALNRTIPTLVGDAAVNLYKENFDKEGFQDGTIQPWKDVKRRDPNSPWYGFSTTAARHFSQTRAIDKILKDSGDLQNSIQYDVRGRLTVAITSDKPYAQVHNEGGTAYIFGKKQFQMPKRQFIGPSKNLDQKIKRIVDDELNRILR